ncbi:MAG: xanthine dehydrogenase small subunit [Gammaproteobacteria bacterium]|nr:xanthine dehydrogenase small subunit [Gammaproteobacteria bacterium]
MLVTAVRFLLDGERIELEVTDPAQTLLQYLREDLRRMGSKEGCAEGDCGACTVVIAELDEDRLRYRAVNACIQFLPTLDGKALFSVESLKSSDGSLHPVQQSMVDHHASQCGFCTPGFIMSMFALYHNNPAPTRADIDDALSGNLCRCTGYRSIVDACRHMYDDYPRVDLDEVNLIAGLRELRRDDGLSLELEQARYHAPSALVELAELYLQHPDAQILAGGTDVGLWVTKQLRELPAVIYLGNVAELKRIDVSAEGIEVGAAVSLTDAFDVIEPHYPEFGEMFRRFASVPVRNAGTLVGNVANGSPIGDSMPALMAVSTRVRLRRGDQQRELAIEDFYLDYMKNALQAGEFIESIIIPPRADALLLRCYKLSKRYDQDISAVCAAFALRLDGKKVSEIRIALGGMAAIPKPALQTEQALLGKNWDESTVRTAMDDLCKEFSPLSDMRASASYRSRATANLLYRFYLETRPGQALEAAAVNVFAVTA